MKRLPTIAAGLLFAVASTAAAQSQSSAAGKAFDAWDADRDGVLSRAEFDNGWGAMAARNVAVRLRSQFDRLDRNSDGSLDGAEYAHLALVLQAGKAAPALEAFDADGDKRLQFNEYVSSVRTMAGANPSEAKQVH